MSQFVDRRADSKGRSAINRERFIRRYKQHIKKSVDKMISERSIKDMQREGNVNIPVKDISEPNFRHQPGHGNVDQVFPGNKQFSEGDKIPRPEDGQGEGKDGQQGGQGDGSDSFQFALSREEFMSLFFDDLELPHLVKAYLGETKLYRTRRAGYTRYGTPGNLSVLRTMRTALARRIALLSALEREEKDNAVALKKSKDDGDAEALESAETAKQALQKRRQAIHFLEYIDLRFRARVVVPDPTVKAVMFCLMDVSASMNEEKKDLAKRFFTLLYLFLSRKYEAVEVIFLRHTDDAEEVDEETFFYDTKSGGTVVLSALKLMDEIIEQRFSDGSWNIYGAQASDGDAFGQDPLESASFLITNLLPRVRYFAYIETPDSVGGSASSLWSSYASVASDRFAMRHVTSRAGIYPVFADLFRKQPA
jgi:uncharacterized sporulation protein YeaH/YhbH (DUF444 family)